MPAQEDLEFQQVLGVQEDLQSLVIQEVQADLEVRDVLFFQEDQEVQADLGALDLGLRPSGIPIRPPNLRKALA